MSRGLGDVYKRQVVTMISKQEEIQLELLTKEEVAHKILDEILKLKG